jgi:hypothetical protein
MMRFILLILYCYPVFATVHPIQFSLPEEKFVTEIPSKDQDFSFIIPGVPETYIHDNELDFYNEYQRSYFAITKKKGGWDCLRHYEILANGCIPYFIDLENCPENTLFLFPKELILEAMHLPGVSCGSIDHSLFDKAKYYEILHKLMEYARSCLTTKQMAQYLLKTVNYSGNGKILYLSSDTSPDYLRCLTLIGLKELLGERIVDFPKINHIYKSYPGDVKRLYGMGFSYTKIIEDLPVDRECLLKRIVEKEFDLVIYGSVHRGLPYFHTVKHVYRPEEIVYLCGEDQHTCRYLGLPCLFLREF